MLLAAAAPAPFAPDAETLGRIQSFKASLTAARESLVAGEAELSKLQARIEEEAEALRKLKTTQPENRSVLAEAEIRSRSRKARELAEQERETALRARESRDKVAEYAATLEVLVADLIELLIRKMDQDLTQAGALLPADREAFADWALQHRRYQELYLSLVPASAEWQERLPRDLASGKPSTGPEPGPALLVQGWKEILERKLFRLQDRRSLLVHEEKIRAKMDQLLKSGSGRFELEPPPGEEGATDETKPRSLREIRKELSFVDREIESLEHKLAALRHLQASPE